MTLNEMLEQVEGSIDLMLGRRDRGWRKLDTTADGFWNSFQAIPLCIPALLLTWLSHGRWLIGMDQTGASMGQIAVSLAVIELTGWVLTILLFFALAGPMNWRERVVPTVVAVNWASVAFAYLQAVPAAIGLLIGRGEGINFITLIIALILLVGYARLLSAAIERPGFTTAGVFVASVALGFLVSDLGHSLFGLVNA